jgi:hypothetical protein
LESAKGKGFQLYWEQLAIDPTLKQNQNRARPYPYFALEDLALEK